MNSVYIGYHPAASRSFALAVFRDLRARGVDALLLVNGADVDALARARTADVLLCVVTPGSAAALKDGGRTARELEQAISLAQPVLGLFAYGAGPADESLGALGDGVRTALRENAVVTPPGFEPDALMTSLDHLYGQLIALFENSLAADDGSRVVAGFQDEARTALRLPPPSADALLAEAWLNRALTTTDPKQRLQSLDKALALAPERTDARMERAVLRLHQGNAQGACDDFDAAAADFSDPRFYVLRGQARRQSGDVQGAASDFGLAVAGDITLAAAWSGRGLCRRALGDYAGALDDFDAALALAPPSAPLLINRGLTRRALAQELDSDEAHALLEAARADYDAALALEPRSAIALNNRGVVRLQLGDVPGAIADLDAALERAPEYASARRNRAAAEEALRRAATSEARSAAETHISLALALAHGGLMESALTELGEALELDPSSGSAYHTRARLRAALGDRDGAFEDFEQALALGPGNALAYADRAEMYLAANQWDRAARDFTRAIRAAPGNAHYLLRRGITRSEACDYERAVEDFSASLERDHRQAAAFYYRGLAHAALEDFSAAISDYNAALAIEPHMAEAYLNRGLAHAALRNPEGTRAAVEDLQLYLVQSTGDDRAEVERILRALQKQR
ncbi:MAG TPA: tetratricopeptide repeat protein [Candidatus Limnocylindrales bacterium]|nr:tetratricopeptide repeat protein [Candidatus Limnocylindrales bacterium]